MAEFTPYQGAFGKLGGDAVGRTRGGPYTSAASSSGGGCVATIPVDDSCDEFEWVCPICKRTNKETDTDCQQCSTER
eukprot:2923866-Pyramimonas_sp.AAC.1